MPPKMDLLIPSATGGLMGYKGDSPGPGTCMHGPEGAVTTDITWGYHHSQTEEGR